ncbi:MAG: class I SAM-dependent methyltransferase, partial [Chlamydiia bacterium]
NLQIMDAESTTFSDNSFDVATLSFGIRNFKNPEQGLEEIYRILKSRGSIHILEFTTPKNRFFRPLFLFYIRRILPFLGGLFTANRKAYHYLNETIETFAQREDFLALLKKAGFQEVEYRSKFLGIVTIYIGKKL